RRWGEDNPLFIAKVRGEFPDTGGDYNVIPWRWIKAAQRRKLEPSEPDQFGVDVGGGDGKNVIAHRRGPVVRIIERNQERNTMTALGILRETLDRLGVKRANIDHQGIGKGMCDRAAELKDKRIVGINVGEPSNDPETYVNLRAEAWWQ